MHTDSHTTVRETATATETAIETATETETETETEADAKDSNDTKHTHLLQVLRGGGLGSRPKKMYGERLGDGVEYHLMKPTPRR